MSQNVYRYPSIKAMSDASEEVGESLIAWQNQSGGQTWYVIYDSAVFKNIGWVERWHIPDRNVSPDLPVYENAWRYVRNATSEEIAAHGNPSTSTVPSGEKNGILQYDELTEETYKKVGYKPDGSGTNLSYSSARVAKSMYNEYEVDPENTEPLPKVSAYITDWCQYDARLPPETQSKPALDSEDNAPGRGFNLENIPPTAYDRLIFSFMAVNGDKGKLSGRINEVVAGWNRQAEASEGEIDPITLGHIVPVDPYGDLGTTRNVGLDADQRRDAGPQNFLQYYNQDAASGLLGGLRHLKERAKQAGHKLELAFSIGGWSMSGYFSVMAKDPDQRTTFVNSIVDFFRRFPMFTAVDIDWEYPGAPGEEGNEFDPQNDGSNYVLLVKELREALDMAFGTRARKEITIACSAVVAKMEKSSFKEIASYLDNIFVMTYDFFGTGWAEYIGHHTNLYPPKYEYDGDNPPPPNPDRKMDYSADEAIRFLLSQGVKPKQIHLGFANYGRSCLGANLTTRSYDIKGNPLGTMEKGAPEFFCLLNNQYDAEYEISRGKNQFELVTDTETDADALFNADGGHWISLDTPRTVLHKGIYAAKMKLGGIFSWSGDQDNGLLANAAHEGLGYLPVGKEKIDMGPLYNRGHLIQLSKITRRKS
ncbi:glycoside hydrolase family 18 protein [Xenorhabdus sp. DI]|uniref:glycoside hydrolase family 18 protein n=1 Tax=Xenorhabdus doucetiae TaxID=351671 RepID=UPI0019B475F2|nr:MULTISPECIES: glycoside hydrolase family 18 protein [unclassified Xenorhabdus]MBD2784171.1 glycoside hydrolase family 18 protein [Xenorhabdus sp. 3]MBD2789612.1 glycoside hydrolase family 18 protein [Xenorhabdus sp. DI]